MSDLSVKVDASANDALFSNKINKLNRGAQDGDREQIKKLSEDFEAIFLELMLKSMRDTVPKGELFDGGNGEDIFRSMLDSEYAKSMASQRFSGIANAIEKSLLQQVEDATRTAQKSMATKAYK